MRIGLAARASTGPATLTPTGGRRASSLAFGGWLIFTVLLFYAIAIGGGWFGLYLGAIRVLNLVIVAIGLGTWLVLAWRWPAWRPTTAIWPAFLAPIIAFALSITFSRFQDIGLDFLAYAVLLVALYLLLVRVMAFPYARARIGGTLVVMTVLLMVTYIVWSLQLWLEWWALVGEIRMPPLRPGLLGMTWGSPSVVFTVLVLLTVASIGGIGLRTRGRRVTAAVLIILLTIAGLISGSRSGWLAMAGTLAIVGVLAVADTRGRNLIARTWSKRSVAARDGACRGLVRPGRRRAWPRHPGSTRPRRRWPPGDLGHGPAHVRRRPIAGVGTRYVDGPASGLPGSR